MAKAIMNYNPTGGLKKPFNDMATSMPAQPMNATVGKVSMNDKVVTKPVALPNKKQMVTPPVKMGVSVAPKPVVSYNPAAPTSVNAGANTGMNTGMSTPNNPAPAPRIDPTPPAPARPPLGYDPRANQGNASAPNNPVPPRVDPTIPAPARPPLGYDPYGNQGGGSAPSNATKVPQMGYDDPRTSPKYPNAAPQTGYDPYDPSGGRGTIPPPITPDNPRPPNTGYTNSDGAFRIQPNDPRGYIGNDRGVVINPQTGRAVPGQNTNPDAPIAQNPRVQLDDDPTTWTPSMMAELAPPRGTTPQFRDVGNYEPNNAKRQKMLKQNAKNKAKNKAGNSGNNAETPDNVSGGNTGTAGGNKKKKNKGKGKVNYNPNNRGARVAPQAEIGNKGQSQNKGQVTTQGANATGKKNKGNKGTKNKNNQNGDKQDDVKLTPQQKRRLNNPRNRPQPGTPERPFRNRGNTSSPMRYGGSLRI